MIGLPLQTGFSRALVLAQTTSMTVREIDWPQSAPGWLLLVFGTLLGLAWVVWWYYRDTKELAVGWKAWLLGLRLATLFGLVVIALNPQERTQQTGHRPSRVALLVDTSLSMRHPAESASGPTPVETRSEKVEKLLGESSLLSELRKTHEVSLYTFHTALEGPHHVFPSLRQTGNADKTAGSKGTEREAPVDWKKLLAPQGLETRLGESLSEFIRQSAGRTLSGVVIVTDGANNSGIDPASARERAIATRTRLVTVGTGTTELPVNLVVDDIQSPTDVQKGDRFDLTAFLRAQGLAGKSVRVELVLLPKENESSEEKVIEQQDVVLEAEGLPTEVKFTLKPDMTGTSRYEVRSVPVQKIVEFNETDNRQAVSVNVFDRPTKVLLFAGGPMRDYQFVRNLLFRHKSYDVDVMLQTGSVGTSQESNKLLLAFPSTREELYEYDAIIAFDPDWRLIPEESIALLSDWVFQEAGGLMFIAGDVNTVQVASMGDQGAASQQKFAPLRELYPVILSSYIAEVRFDQDSRNPWPIQLTADGRGAPFLQLTDDPVSSLVRWKEFPGFYRCYPTAGAKAGATIYARFTDPRAQNEFGFPILLAGQFYGQGRTLYLGSEEFWQLRSEEAEYDRLWIKTVRELTQGRTRRGTRRGLLMPEAKRTQLGETVPVRARILTAQFLPVEDSSVAMEIIDPTGRVLPPRVLAKDPGRKGEYVGDFRAAVPGTYRLSVAIPDSRDRLTEEVVVAIPKLEDENIRQDQAALIELARDTGGTYLPIEECAEAIPALLPDRGEPYLINERLRTLWDRGWVLYLLAGLLTAEWLTRKLLKLA